MVMTNATNKPKEVFPAPAPPVGNPVLTNAEGDPLVILDPVEADQPDRSKWWNRLAFAVSLWLKLLLRGRVFMFPVYWAQARHETASFESYGFNDRRNPWGMRPAQQRTRYWSSEHGGFAVYSSYWKAIADRLDWDRVNGVLPLPGTKYIGAFPFDVWLGTAYTVNEGLQYAQSWRDLLQDGDGWLRKLVLWLKWLSILATVFAFVLLFMRMRRGLRRRR